MNQSCINALVLVAALIALKNYAPEMYDIIMDIGMKMLQVISNTLDTIST